MKTLLALSLFSGLAIAQEPIDQADEPVDGFLTPRQVQNASGVSAHFGPSGFWSGKADMDDNRGELKVNEWSLGGGHRWPLPGGASGVFGVGLEHSRRRYKFSDGAGLGGFEDPFDHVRDFRGTLFGETQIDREWSVFGAATLAAGGEDGEVRNGVYGEFAGGFEFAVQENLHIGLEVITFTGLEDHASVYAFPVIQMEINEDSRITTVTDSTDPMLAYEFDITHELTSYFGAGVRIRQYALDQDPLPDHSAVRDQEVAVRGGMRYSYDRFLMDLFVGVAWRKLKLSADNDQIDQDSIDPAPLVGASVTYGFY